MANKPAIPLRSLTVEPPTKAAIRAARMQARCTMKEAAELVYVPTSYFRDAEQGVRVMHPAIAELFAIKAGLIKPEYIIRSDLDD